ncbi:MAG TPA: 16S rRNA (guanine(966)-N(2))-methyltransferase RsmD [Candidatus Binataceae bacterium]|nr:16S rRNA (guanine(966)-N(2))-methyltransferase RsmD [Candidatus Binataceae bacterium]
MRVIAGDARGRRMVAPRGLATRPATARVRQSIFSRLAARTAIDGARVLDLYAGSGSLGIEALSRGAATAVFVDSARSAAGAIERNLETLGLRARGELIIAEAGRALTALGARGARFDLVFIDAPYADDRSAERLTRIVELGLLADGGWVVVRQAGRVVQPAGAGLEQVGTSTMGDHRITLYRRAPAAC